MIDTFRLIAIFIVTHSIRNDQAYIHSLYLSPHIIVRMERWIENVALSDRAQTNRNFYSENLKESTSFGFFCVDVLILYGTYLVCCILSCLVSMAVNCPGCICSCLVGIVAVL